MSFNSIMFAIFLPVVFAGYWIMPHKYRWILLLIASYYFYMSWDAKYVILILFVTIASYIVALLLEKVDESKKKAILAVGILICLSILFFFKYFDFCSETLSGLLNIFQLDMHPKTLNLVLPMGISFYTFQTLGYMIDVYHGKVKAEHHFGIYATFISFFPQLVAGPIERTENLLPQIREERYFDYDNAVYGLRLMLWGYFKKIVVADTVARYVDIVYGNLRYYSGFELAIAVLFFTIQIYCDFSGYSDIAIGTAKLLGIDLMTNFRSPYFSASIKEFWSRWHISLSTWFRDYIYIPLGGNRCSKHRHYFNVLTTFLVSGLWHGADWTFVLWGGVHGLIQVSEELFVKPLQKIRKTRIGKILIILLVFIICNLLWVFFRADSVADALYVIAHMLDGVTKPAIYFNNSIGLSKLGALKITTVVLVVAIFDYVSIKHDVFILIKTWPKLIRVMMEYAFVIAILWCIISSMGTNQFVYFQF